MRKINTFVSISSLTRRVFSIIREQMDGLIPSDMLMKMLTLEPLSYLQAQLLPFLGKMIRFMKFKQGLWKNKHVVKFENEIGI